MQDSRTPRLLAAAAVVALAGTASADRYTNPAQMMTDGDGATGYTAAQQDAIAARVTGVAGFFDTTLTAEVIYNTGTNVITADNVRVTLPVLIWENDAAMNTPVLEQLTDGTIAGFTGTFTDGTFQPFELATARGTLVAFSTVTGANANNIFHDENFTGSEGDFLASRSNPTGQVLPSGLAVWDANFSTPGGGVAAQNNHEMLDLDGSSSRDKGNVIPPNQTNMAAIEVAYLADQALMTPLNNVVPAASGIKLLRNPGTNFNEDAGIDSANPFNNQGVRLATPSVVQSSSFFIQWFGNGFDGANGNNNGGLAVNGHTIFQATANPLDVSAAAVDVSAPQHAWPIVNSGGVLQAPAIPGAAQGDYRNNNAKLFRLDCGSVHILGSYAITGSNTTVGGASDSALILFIDNANSASSAGNGYTDGAYYIPASPNFAQGHYMTQYDFTDMTGAGAPGNLGDYRFLTDNVSDNSARTFDANGSGDFVITWQNRSDTSGTDAGVPFDDERIYEIRLYEATVNSCVADEYSAPFVVARTGTTISERGITYNNGFEFDIPQTLFCNDITPVLSVPGVANNVSFSGCAIDDAGNVSFTATTEVFVTDLVDDGSGFPAFADCFDGSEDGSAADGVIDKFLEGSTTGLFYYLRSEDALLKLVDGGIGGTELMSTVAGAPETLSVVLGRFTGDDDSDRFGAHSMTNTGDVMSVAFRPGNFDRNAGNAIDPMDMDSDDPSGVFLSDGVTQEDGGLLIDRSQATWDTTNATTNPSQVVTAVRGAVVVELGDVTIEPKEPENDCFYDTNNDGLVDIIDFGAFGTAFGSMLGDPNFDPALDSNGDDLIDIIDFGLFGMEFNRTDCLDG